MYALLRRALTGCSAGIENIIIGMAHRGRLNLLTGLLEFAPRALFSKFRGGDEIPKELVDRGALGDIISHLGTSHSSPT